MSGGPAGSFPGGTPAGRTGLFDELVSVDPSIAPGLQRPIGWRALKGDGTAAWFKTGAAATAWTAITALGGGSISLLTSTDGSVTITNPAGPTADLSVVGGGGGGAAWPIGIATRRFFALDPVSGNDANAGFSDVSAAAAGAVAKQTEAGLAAIFPKIFNGRAFEVIVLGGGRNYSAALMNMFKGAVGYDVQSILRATVTNATAGSVKFAGTLADVQMAGFVTATGMNATGYNPTTATGIVLTLTKVGGGAPAFPAEPALPQGYRTRFDSATTTAALRNKCVQNWKVNAGSIEISDNVLDNITTAATDVCYVEMPGATVPTFTLGDGSPGFVMLGIGCSGAMFFEGFTGQFSVVGGVGTGTKPRECTISMDRVYTHPTAGVIDVGMGYRDETTLELGGCDSHVVNSSTKIDLIVTASVNHEDYGTTIGRQYFARGGVNPITQVHAHAVIGNGGLQSGLGPSTRMFGASININSFDCTIDGVNVDGSAAGIEWTGTSRCTIGSFGVKGNVTGLAALSLVGAEQTKIQCSTEETLTATGTRNAIAVAAHGGIAYAPWSTLSQLVFGCLPDTAGNLIIGGLPAAAHGSTHQNICDAALVGPVVGLKNTTGAPVAQWSLVTEGGGQNIFLAKADSFPNAAGLPFVMLTPALNNDWAICALQVVRAPVIFDAPPAQSVVFYLSTANAGQVQTAIPALAGTNQKFRLGITTKNASGVSTNAGYFNPELYPTTADGLK